MNDELAQAIIASAGRLGIDPVDLGTAVSYETSGSFDPWKAGPTTKWGQHRGLIQWGEPQRAKYGVTSDMSVSDQMKAAEKYLVDAGVKPGGSMMDIYSAINAGSVGREGASDAAAGGAPGSVRDKVLFQMGGHRDNARRMLGMLDQPQSVALPAAAASSPAVPAMASPMGAVAAPMEIDKGMLAALNAIAKTAQEDHADDLPLIEFGTPPGMARARAAMRHRMRG